MRDIIPGVVLTETAGHEDFVDTDRGFIQQTTHVGNMPPLRISALASVIPSRTILRARPSTILASTRITLPLPGAPTPSPSLLSRRDFHPTRRRDDVFFVALPAIKSTLLSITRASLLFLPFVWRYRYAIFTFSIWGLGRC
jgi:hypothetical protein